MDSTASNTNVIEVRGLRKTFNGNTALSGIDFTVPRGSIYGFLGPNGAGKTTTIRILLGLIHKTDGIARIFGEEAGMGKGIEFKKRIGYLPQDPVFPAGLTGREVMSFIADTYGMPSAGRKAMIDDLLEQFDLAQAASRKVEGYSRGMKQRLGLAAVVLPQPELVVLDEPVSALDPEGRYQALTMIAGMRGRSTVFFSSHILADVERVCDRVVMIDKGEKLLESSLDDLMSRYSTEQYLLKVDPASTQAVLSWLKTQRYVREASETDGAIIVSAHHGQLDDLRRGVIGHMAESGILVTEFSLIKRDLEKIFLDIVGNGSRRNGHEDRDH